MKLERWMKIKGYTDGQFAELIGMSRVAVNLYRHGHRVPRPAVMEKISDATAGRVKPNDFYKQ